MKHLFFTLLLFLPLAHAGGEALQAAVQEYRQRQTDATPAQVLDWLKEGNRRFRTDTANHGGFPTNTGLRRRVAARGQRPLAAVLSCIDSRTTPELVFDTSIGDLFTARVGAGVINDDILGSLEVAAASGAKVIVVLGHTRCGGVAAACAGEHLEHFTQLLDKIKPAIVDTNAMLDADPALSRRVGARDATNPLYIAEVSHTNAAQSARQIRERSQTLREMLERGEILLVPAMYDVDSGEVRF